MVPLRCALGAKIFELAREFVHFGFDIVELSFHALDILFLFLPLGLRMIDLPKKKFAG